MLCENCGKREATVRYSENINGNKKELNLCEECSKKLGIIDKMNFKMPTFGLSDFFGGFLDDFDTPEVMPLLNEMKEEKCDSCGTTFEDIINTGKYGCPNCYETFEDKMDPILRKLQGANRHVGRLGKVSKNNIKFEKDNKKAENEEQNKEENKISKLEDELKQAIKEERYEDAAKIRDEIKDQKKKAK